MRVPSYRLHRASGQAVVTVAGRDHYLGRHGTPESRERYRRLIAELLASAGGPPRPGTALLVVEVLDRYLTFAEGYYVKGGRPTSQLDRVRRSLAPVRDLYGRTPAADFGPLALKAVRQAMVDAGLSRRHINHRVGCVKRCFKWAAAEELVPGGVYHALCSVEGLKAGRTAAPDHPPVTPAPEAAVEAVLSRLQPALADAARTQLLTACRPGEALAMRWEELDRSRPVWLYRPSSWKTQHHGHAAKFVLVGPRAQAVLRRWLPVACPLCGTEGRAAELAARAGLCGPCSDRAEEQGLCGPWPEARPAGHVFSPRVSVRLWNRRRRAARRSKVQPSQLDRSRPAPAKAPGERYAPQSYARAVARACEAAGVPRWHPHQLRHNAATRLVEQFGWEVARIVLGHRSVDVTRLYAEDDLGRALEAVRASG